jgi:hypothetical protein
VIPVRARPDRRWSGEAVAIGLFAALHTLVFFARQDRFAVLFWWTRDSWPYIALLWLKDIALSAVAFLVFAEVARATLALPAPLDRLDHSSRIRHALLFTAILGAGLTLRWIAPVQIPPGVWVDALLEAEGALRDPGRISWIGGRPYGTESHALVSNLYLKICELLFRVFGRGDVGILALSAAGGSLALPAVYFLGKEVRGPRVGLIAMALVAFGSWPLIYSRWAWVGATLLPLVAGASALTLAAARRRSPLLAIAAGVLLGLSLHTHPTAWAVALGFAVFALFALFRRAVSSKLVILALVGCCVVLAPFAAAFLEYPERIGGRPQDVSLLAPVKDPTIPSAFPTRFIRNAVLYTGLVLWTSDPNPRHGLRGRPTVGAAIGFAALAGLAVCCRSARDRWSGDRLLLLIAATSLSAGILANPAGAPNGLRVFPLVAPVVVWAADAANRSVSAAARSLSVRAPFLWALAFALLFAAETVPFLSVWPADPSVAEFFCLDESAAGRSRRDLGAAPTIVAPGSLGWPIVFETLAAGAGPRDPIPRSARRSAPDLVRSAPDRPFWYIARAEDLDALRRAGWRTSAKSRDEANGRAVVVRILPPRR